MLLTPAGSAGATAAAIRLRFTLGQRLGALQQQLHQGHSGRSLPFDAAASSKPVPCSRGTRRFLARWPGGCSS